MPNPIHASYPITYTFIAGSSDPALRSGDGGEWYQEIQTGPRNFEYWYNPQWATTRKGGVMVDWYTPEIISDTGAGYAQARGDNPPDGTRLNSVIEPWCNFVEDPKLGGVWWGVQANGQLIRIDRAGTVATVVGFNRDRSKLTYRHTFFRMAMPSEEEMNTKRYVSRYIYIRILDYAGGAQDLCFDPRDATGNTLPIVCQVDQLYC